MCAAWPAKAAGRGCPGVCGCRRWWPIRPRRCHCWPRCRTIRANTCRSVANHLNDIAKDHPALVVAWVREHLPDASRERRALLRHASRTLIKQGHADMLALWGASMPFEGRARLTLSSRRLGVGDTVMLNLSLRSDSAQAQSLLIDYAVHHVKANGSTSAKIFKGWSLTLAPGEARALVKSHSMRAVTTRRYHAGRHRIDVRINGQALAQAAFSLTID